MDTLCAICGQPLVERRGVLVCAITGQEDLVPHLAKLEDPAALLVGLRRIETELEELEKSVGAKFRLREELAGLRSHLRSWQIASALAGGLQQPDEHKRRSA